MKFRITTIFLATLTLTASLGARAASVSLVPSTTNVLQGDTFTVALVLDATDLVGTIGESPGAYAGNITLDYDGLRLSYEGFAFEPAIAVTMAATTGTDGNRSTVSLGFANAADTSTIGAFTFKARDSVGTTNLGLAEYASIIPPFFSQEPTVQPFYPGFLDTSITISAVPLPATAWLLATGFGLVGLRQRIARKARSRMS